MVIDFFLNSNYPSLGDTNKRKLSQSHSRQHPEKHAKLSASGNLMLNTQHSRQHSSTPSLSSASSTGSSSATQQQQKHQSAVNQFYSAALSHLQHTSPASKAAANPFALASGPSPFSPSVAGNPAAVVPFTNSPGNNSNQRYVITTNNYWKCWKIWVMLEHLFIVKQIQSNFTNYNCY